MIEQILPGEAVAVDTREDWLEDPLSSDEELALGNAVERRRREFTTARSCARHALEGLGRAPSSIPVGNRGEPLWPPGVVGSITHCTGYRGCAVARTADIVTLGIDAEPHAPLPDGVINQIALPRERVWLAELMREQPAICWDRLLFSAKEAVYKAWFPLTRRWLGFKDATITLDLSRRSFHVNVLVAAVALDGSTLATIDGRWLIRDGLVLTAVARAQE